VDFLVSSPLANSLPEGIKGRDRERLVREYVPKRPTGFQTIWFSDNMRADVVVVFSACARTGGIIKAQKPQG